MTKFFCRRQAPTLSGYFNYGRETSVFSGKLKQPKSEKDIAKSGNLQTSSTCNDPYGINIYSLKRLESFLFFLI
jgi:hypothetical protein